MAQTSDNNITFTRGDTYSFKFQRKNSSGEVITTQPDKMWFTVKSDYESTEHLIQKTLGNGITFSSTDNFFHVLINNADTRDLEYGTYVYDVQVKVETSIKTIAIGKLKLTQEVTFDYE